MNRWSRLTVVVAAVLDRMAPAPLSAEDRDLLEVLVADHLLDGPAPPEWMVALFEDIAASRFNRPRQLVPGEYPRGEMGLANLLADIEDELFPLGIDDYGEFVHWPIPPFGVRVVISRETRGPEPRLYLERLPGPKARRAGKRRRS